MRLQILFFLIFLAIIRRYQCEEVFTTTVPAKNESDWDWVDNYDLKDEIEKPKKPSNDDESDLNEDKKDSHKKKPDDEDKSHSDEKQPSRHDDEDDDRDRGDNKDPKPSEPHSNKPRKRPDYIGHMNIYLGGSSRHGRKRRPTRFRFPVARYDPRRYPMFGPLINFLPWLPIFVEARTKQTIIYSPTGGVYILPPVINFYGQLYSIAELIASGYASLVSSGAPPPPAVDVAPLVQQNPVVGPGVPTVNPNTGGFQGGVHTELNSFARPKYPLVYEENSNHEQQDYNRNYRY